MPLYRIAVAHNNNIINMNLIWTTTKQESTMAIWIIIAMVLLRNRRLFNQKNNVKRNAFFNGNLPLANQHEFFYCLNVIESNWNFFLGSGDPSSGSWKFDQVWYLNQLHANVVHFFWQHLNMAHHFIGHSTAPFCSMLKHYWTQNKPGTVFFSSISWFHIKGYFCLF